MLIVFLQSHVVQLFVSDIAVIPTLKINAIRMSTTTWLLAERRYFDLELELFKKALFNFNLSF